MDTVSISYYQFFDVNLSFLTNSKQYENTFQKVYGYFRINPVNAQIACSITKDSSLYHIKAISKRYKLDYKTDKPPETDTYLSLFSPVIYEVKGYFLIHAGSLSTHDNKSLIISAPCSFGKTTNTRELCKEGFKLLSDELAPLGLETGLIHPYPRGMGVLSKTKKDIVEIPKDIIGDISQPAFVVFLAPEKKLNKQNKRYLEIALGRITDNIINSFKKLDGVKNISTVNDRIFPILRLLLEEDAYITAGIEDICSKNGVPILYTQKGETCPPDYNAKPKLEEISPKEGVFELSQNILNATNSALLEEVFSGSRAKMIFELAGLMGNTRFFTLTIGKLEEMTNLIKKLCLTEKL
jgi:hypothetical protein